MDCGFPNWNKKLSDKSILNRSWTDCVKGSAILMILLYHAVTNVDYLPRIFKVFYPLGAFGTAIFFCFSGYGNTLSIKKDNGGGVWLFKRLSRLLMSFILVFTAYTIIMMILGDEIFCSYSGGQWLIQFVTLTIPPFTSWYLKTQFVVYIVHYIMYRTIQDDVRRNYALTAVFALYVFILILTGTADYWWTSVFCYQIGVLAAEHKDQLIGKLSNLYIILSLILISGILYAMSFKIVLCIMFFCIFGCITIISLSTRFTMKQRVLMHIGHFTYELYLSQAILIHIFLQKVVDLKNNEIEILVYVFGSLIIALIVYLLSKYIQEKLTLAIDVRKRKRV